MSKQSFHANLVSDVEIHRIRPFSELGNITLCPLFYFYFEWFGGQIIQWLLPSTAAAGVSLLLTKKISFVPTALKKYLSHFQDDEESPASEGEASGSPSGSGSGRLVIDEGGGEAPTEGAAEQADTNEDTPLCQGCRRRDAQFVCAGCANQWYCSRDCQVRITVVFFCCNV